MRSETKRIVKIINNKNCGPDIYILGLPRRPKVARYDLAISHGMPDT